MLLSNWNKNYDKLLIKIDFDDDLPQCFLLSISSKLENEFTEIWLQTKLIQFYNSILFKVRKNGINNIHMRDALQNWITSADNSSRTHCGLVTPYGVRCLSQHRFR